MKVLGLLIGAGVMALAASQADATISLYLQNGSSAATLAATSNSGALNYQAGYGSFVLNNIAAIGSPYETSPDFVTQSINVSSASAGALSVYLVQSGVTGLAPSLLSTFTANSFIGNITSVVESTYYSMTDPFATGSLSATPLSTATFTNIGSSYQVKSLNGVTRPYYEIAKYTVTVGAGGGTANDTINVSGVPEPASWATMMLGFGFMGFALRQRRRSAVSFG